MKFTRTTLQKLEAIFGELEYTIRYERGSFQSGYCIVEDRKIAVINKFFETEARINVLLEILLSVEVDESIFSDKTLEFYKKVDKAFLQQHRPVEEEEANENSEVADSTEESENSANTEDDNDEMPPVLEEE